MKVSDLEEVISIHRLSEIANPYFRSRHVSHS